MYLSIHTWSKTLYVYMAFEKESIFKFIIYTKQIVRSTDVTYSCLWNIYLEFQIEGKRFIYASDWKSYILFKNYCFYLSVCTTNGMYMESDIIQPINSI